MPKRTGKIGFWKPLPLLEKAIKQVPPKTTFAL